MIEAFLIWLGAIVATEAVVELIASSEIIFPVRDWMSQHSAFLGKLVNCGYCVSVWVAALLFSYYLPTGEFLKALCSNNWIVWAVVLIGKAAIVHRLSNVLHEKFSRWFHKYRLGIELIHVNVGKK
jgi:hypothetical protein